MATQLGHRYQGNQFVITRLDPWEVPLDLPPLREREPPSREHRRYDREGLRPPVRDERDMMREPPTTKSLATPKKSIEMEIFLVSSLQK